MMYTLASVARKLSSSNRGHFVTEDTLWSWVKQGVLQAERVPKDVSNWGKYPYWAEESHWRAVLEAKGYDADSIFFSD
jgi:hypothetical protein